MRTTLLTSAALLGLAMALPAMAQTADPAPASPPAAQGTAPAPDSMAAPATAPAHTHHHRMKHSAEAAADGSGQWAHEPGTGESGPASAQASNIDGADTHSAIAPHLPSPMVGENAGPDGYLRAADRALAAHKTGAAQQALEMAETRLLDRSTAAGAAGQPDQNPRIASVAAARKHLAAKDWAGARAAIQAAMAGREDSVTQGEAPGQMRAPDAASMPPQGGVSTTTDTSNVSVTAPQTGHDVADGHPGANPAPLAGTNGGSLGAAGVNNPGAPVGANPSNPGIGAK